MSKFVWITALCLLFACDSYRFPISEQITLFQITKTLQGEPLLRFSLVRLTEKDAGGQVFGESQYRLRIENISGKDLEGDIAYRLTVYKDSLRFEDAAYTFVGTVKERLAPLASSSVAVTTDLIAETRRVEVAVLSFGTKTSKFKGYYSNQAVWYDENNVVLSQNRCFGTIEADGALNIKMADYTMPDALKNLHGNISANTDMFQGKVSNVSATKSFTTKAGKFMYDGDTLKAVLEFNTPIGNAKKLSLNLLK